MELSVWFHNRMQAFVSVWYPGKYRVELSDPDGTLSSLLPVNVPMSSVERCTDRWGTVVALHQLSVMLVVMYRNYILFEGSRRACAAVEGQSVPDVQYMTSVPGH